MNTEKEEEFLRSVLLGREDAVLLCRLMFNVSQVWDDLIDGDEEVSNDRINAGFVNALLRIPAIPFYIENLHYLYPVVQMAIYDWMASNHLERGSDHDKNIAFVIRDSLTNLVVQCAFLVGGHDHAIKMAPGIRAFFHDEPLEEYVSGLEVQV